MSRAGGGCEPFSSALLDPSAPEATGADQDALNAAGRSGPYLLQIGLPPPLGFVVGVANVVANRRAFAANRAMSHW
jgi:hypothetical protein